MAEGEWGRQHMMHGGQNPGLDDCTLPKQVGHPPAFTVNRR